ncbi:unnamed protein product [Caenorhabditis brenneri]
MGIYESPESIELGDGDIPSEYRFFSRFSKPSYHHIPKLRAQRATKTCGQKIIEYTLQVCKTLDSQANTQKDISTICCSSKCSDEFIKQAMCPQLLKTN